MRKLYEELLKRLSALQSEAQTKETSARVSELKRTITLIEFNEEYVSVITETVEELETINNIEPHGCPYQEEIHGNYDFTCCCDEEATHQCSQDI